MQILKIFSHEIIDRISGDLNSFVDIFYEKEVITVQDKEEIQAEKERKGSLAASFMLVDKLPTKISTWYEKLISIAEQFHLDDIVEILDVPEGRTNVNRNLSCFSHYKSIFSICTIFLSGVTLLLLNPQVWKSYDIFYG